MKNTPKTIDQIRHLLRLERLPSSPAQVRRYIAKLNIAPLGARKRPQVYAPDAAARIKAHLCGHDGSAAPVLSMATIKTQAGRN